MRKFRTTFAVVLVLALVMFVASSVSVLGSTPLDTVSRTYVDGTAFVPFRQAANAYGATVQWDGENQAVVVTTVHGDTWSFVVAEVGGFNDEGTVFVPVAYASSVFYIAAVEEPVVEEVADEAAYEEEAVYEEAAEEVVYEEEAVEEVAADEEADEDAIYEEEAVEEVAADEEADEDAIYEEDAVEEVAADEEADEADADYEEAVYEEVVAEVTGIHGMITRVTYGYNTAYVFGSFHFGRAHWFPLSDIVEDAMARSDVFAFEIDMDEYEAIYQDLEVLELMAGWMVLPDGLTMADILPDDILENFIGQLELFGIDFDTISILTPSMFVSMFTLELMEEFVDMERDYSVDYYVANFARANNRPIIGLNTVLSELEFQLNIPLEIQPYALVDFDIMAIIESFDEIDLIDAYEVQDIELLREIMSVSFYEGLDNPFVLHTIDVNFNQRCNIFANEIARLLQETEEPTTFFVTIGLGHIIGSPLGHVLQLLEGMGFEVESLWQ